MPRLRLSTCLPEANGESKKLVHKEPGDYVIDPSANFPPNTGFRFTDDIIHLFIGGSELHGAKLAGTDDHDLYGIYVEPPHKILGIDIEEHFVWSTNGSGTRNCAQDTDLTLYGLRKWAGLACKGNPSVLHSLFAPNLVKVKPDVDTWQRILNARRDFLAISHYKQFLGYAKGQISRMAGERSHKVNRPELVEKYGFDTKFAMHTIRVLSECQELLETGWLSLPSREKELLIGIRKGEVTQDWVIREATKRMNLCEQLAKTSKALPPEINRSRVSNLIADLYRMHWQKWRL